MTTLIVGGTGFVGTRIARRLVDMNEKVVSLDSLPDAASLASLRDKVAFARGDVSIIEDILSVVKTHKIERIVNLAYVLASESDMLPHTSIRVNALGASNVLEAARLVGIERVVYASSIAVYGDQSLYGERPVTEEDLAAPTNLYGAAKLLNEHEAAAHLQLYGLSVAGIRVGVVAGHGRTRGQGLWADRFASDPAVGRPTTLPFARDTRASLIYVDDVAELFVRVLMAPRLLHSIYNSGGDDVTLGELTDQVRQIVPEAIHTFGAGKLRLPYSVSSATAECEFSWSRRPLLEHLREHVAEARRALAR